MIKTEDLIIGQFRLLEVDKLLQIPINTQIRLVVTSQDVIHSFAVPSLSLKIDAVPGRLNQTHFSINRLGIFYGQCSEIYGSEYSFMPIVISSESLNYYLYTSIRSSLNFCYFSRDLYLSFKSPIVYISKKSNKNK